MLCEKQNVQVLYKNFIYIFAYYINHYFGFEGILLVKQTYG